MNDDERVMYNLLDKFFQGEDHFQTDAERKLGFIWVAKHSGYDTLTFEPVKGGQYEIAVRIKVDNPSESDGDDIWQGYKVADPFKDFMYGVNTGGH